jgi:hypothetical protein
VTLRLGRPALVSADGRLGHLGAVTHAAEALGMPAR